jgi:hypothetical protein
MNTRPLKHSSETPTLSIAEQQLIGCYHTTGPGRPPRNPLGILRALIVMRMKEIRSLRELTRILDVDHRIRRLCLIKHNKRGYTRSVISRFTTRVGAERLQLIIEEKVIWLMRRAGISEVDAVLDASFVKAWSVRNPEYNKVGFSDSNARVGRGVKGKDQGYRLRCCGREERTPRRDGRGLSEREREETFTKPVHEGVDVCEAEEGSSRLSVQRG